MPNLLTSFENLLALIQRILENELDNVFTRTIKWAQHKKSSQQNNLKIQAYLSVHLKRII